jgi:ferredoxin
MPTVSLIYVSPETGENTKEESFELAAEELIFDGLDRQGVTLPHGCLAGSCGSCAISVSCGADNIKPMSRVEADTVEHVKTTRDFPAGEGVRLSCRAKITGDITLKLVKND